MKNRTIIKNLFLALILLLPVAAIAADMPHSNLYGNTVTCGNCHWISGSTPPWASYSDPAAMDNTVNNRRCLTCHDGSKPQYPTAKTHSTATTSNTYWKTMGGWTTQCTTCHDPHNQRQTRMWKTLSYVQSGSTPTSLVWNSGTNRTIINLPTTLWSTYVGYYILPDISYPIFYKISDIPSSTQVEVQGIVNGNYVKTNGFAIVYGRNFKETMTYVNPGGQQVIQPVKMFRPEGPYSLTDPANHATSLCTVCHTQTDHMRASWVSSSAPDQWHNSTNWSSGQNCMTSAGCHQQHDQGFKKGATCGDCHGTPPTYWYSVGGHNLTKMIKIGGFTTLTNTGVNNPGAHETHVLAGMQAYSNRAIACQECHNTGMLNPTDEDPTVGDKIVQMGFKTAWYTLGTYDGRSSLSNGFTYGGPGMGGTGNSLRCSNVYCHGTTLWSSAARPIWTSTSVNCGDCHKATAANPPTVGSHVKHVANWSSMQAAIACSTCHGHSGVGVAQHVDGSATWNMTTAGAGAQYNGVTIGQTGPVPSVSYGNCSNVYCHSNGAPVGAAATWSTVLWGGTAMSCTSCHNMAGATSAMGQMSPAHAKHAATDAYGNAGRGSNAINCTFCHYLTNATGNNITNKTKHANSIKDVDFSTWHTLVSAAAGNYNTVSRTCSGLYCHSDGKGSTKLVPTWTTLGQGCNTCHGYAPDYANGGGGSVTANSHMVHWATNNIGCEKCHFQTTRDGSTVWVTSRHVDGNIRDVYYDSGNPSGWYSTGNKSCGSLYCHSTGTPQWGGSSIVCGTCHIANRQIGGKHAAHYSTIGNASDRSAVNNSSVAGYIYNCGVCHYNTAHSTGKWTTFQTANVALDSAIAGGGSYTQGANMGVDAATNFNWTAGTCASTYCHSSGAGNAPNVTNFNWNTSFTVLDCKGCHNYNTASGKWMSSGAHKAHVNTYTFDCSRCHSVTTGVDAWQTITNRGLHVNRIADVSYDGMNPSGTWGTVSKNCTSTYCHSDGKGGAKVVPVWTTLGLGCNACHGYAPDYANGGGGTVTANSHMVHWSTNSIGCQKCHYQTTRDGSTVWRTSGRHVDANIRDVYYDATNPSGWYSTGNKSCGSTYCHGVGVPQWGAAPSACTSCHAVNQTIAGKHSAHWGTSNAPDRAASNDSTSSHYMYRCGVCHYNSPHATGAWTSNQSADITFDPAIAVGGNYTAGTAQGTDPATNFKWTAGTCANTYCHSTGTGSGPNVTNFNWNTAPTALNCAGCHSYTKVSGVWLTTGMHAEHTGWVTGAGSAFTCEKCHNATTTNGTTIANKSKHINNAKEVSFDAWNNNGSWATVTKSCANLYCHSNVQGSWGSTGPLAYASPTWTSTGSGACGTCHGIAGPTWNTLASGSHTKHLNSASIQGDCSKCHITAGSGTTLHTNRNIDVIFSGGGSYTQSASNAPGNGYGTCASVCHPTGSWGSSGSVAGAGCTLCHAANNTLAGKHAVHYNSASTASTYGDATNSSNLTGYVYQCGTCHYTNPSHQSWVTNQTLVRVVFDPTTAGGGWYTPGATILPDSNGYNWSNGMCSNTYCHSSGTGNPPNRPVSSWNWLTAAPALDCKGCHNYTTASGSWMSTGSHRAHVNTYTFDCSKCHSLTTGLDAWQTITNKGMHVNKIADVYYDAMNPAGLWLTTTKSCSTAYCHSTGAGTYPAVNAAWASSGTGACGTCHGATAASVPYSAAHNKHVGTAASGYKYACYWCHNSVVNVNTDSFTWPTIKSTTLHVNTMTEMQFGGTLNPSGAWATVTKTCSNTYCHSSGTAVVTGSLIANSVTWAASINCSSCHGNAAWDTTGMPWYTTAAQGGPKTNSHVKHKPYDCSKCHYVTTTNGTTITSFSRHANRTYDLAAGTGTAFNYTYTSTGSSCSNISCHYNNTATWGATLTCGACHNALSVTHSTHTIADGSWGSYGVDNNSSTSGLYRFNCGICHPFGSSTKHADGVLDIELYNASATGFKANNPNTAWSSYTGPNRICGNVYCHSNGNIGAVQYRVTPAWGTVYGANKCGQCHDNPPQYAGQAHYVSNAFMGKEGGHMIGIHWDNIYNGSLGKAWATTLNTGSHGNSGTSTTITCYVCHSTVVTTAADTYAMNGTASGLRCGQCHTAGTTTPLQNGAIADKSLHVNAQKDVVIANSFAVNARAQLRTAPSGWTRNVGYKVAGAYDSATLSSSGWSTSTKTCVTACHLGQSTSWTTTGVACSSCHNGL